MADPSNSKKTQSIELRVSPELKSAISALSAERGESVSETIRSVLSHELARPADPIDQTGAFTMARMTSSASVRMGIFGATALGLAAVYSLAAQTPAIASAAREARVTFAEVDRDGDGMITPEEYAVQLTAEFAEEPFEPETVPPACAGTFIEEEIAAETAEMSRSPAELAEERVLELDSDGSRSVTFEELEAFLVAERAREFLEFDEDGNGYVTLDEVTLLLGGGDREEEAAYLAEEGLSEACIAAILGDDGLEEPREDPNVVLAEFDSNRDGRVGLMEFLEH